MTIIPLQWICRGAGCNDTSEEYIPDVQQWMNAIGDISKWMMAGAAAMTGLVICLSLLHLIFVSTLISDEKIRSELYWVVLMPPVIVVCGFTGMVLLRAALFLQNFRRFEVLVFQSPVVRIMLEILNITVFMELSSRKHLYFQISNFAAMISMFIAHTALTFAALPYRRLLPIVLVRSKVCRRLLRHYRHGAYNIARFHQIALFGGGTM
ncbi:hypothetical protein niasHS_011839 [Heterodera schachtii]|uniref:Uncharacterized protein n=1 Tax=Heterodera schachtii TaxID=97005 RepID=A0ABD2INW3_HETSC